MMTPDLAPHAGFTDPVFDSQAVFRAVMDAMARPGRTAPIAGLRSAPPPLSPVAAAVALALVDHETPVWLDAPLAGTEAVRAWLTFHSGAPIVETPAQASFAIVSDPPAMPRLDRFALGSEAYPDRSTTLILQVTGFSDRGPRLTGPGVDDSVRLAATPLPETFWAQLRENRAMFPRGVDIALAGPDSVAALPRSLQPGCA